MRTLSLKKETLADLSEVELAYVVGAWGHTAQHCTASNTCEPTESEACSRFPCLASLVVCLAP